MPMTFGRCKTFLMLLAASYCHGYTAPASTAFATFGNAAARDLIKGWMPKPLAISSKNQGMLPTSQENMKRVIRARILLEDANTGCVACSEDALCVILCRFSKAEHQLILPVSTGLLLFRCDGESSVPSAHSFARPLLAVVEP